MNVKKKLAAIFTTLLMILSFVAVVPFPVQAQPVAAVSILDLAMKDPGTGAFTPGPFTPGGNPPMNLVLTNINNASRMGNILITAVYLIDLGTGISVDSYTVGFTFDPAVLKVATGGVYPVSIAPGLLPPTIFEGTGFVPTPGVINNYAGYVANYTVSSTAGPIAVGVGGAKPLLYVVFVMNYWGKTNIDFTVTASPTQTTVSNLGAPHALLDLDGYYEFSVHKVITSAGFDAYWGDPPAPYPSLVGENLTVTVSIKNTEAIHSWQLNMSYNPAVFSLSAGPATVQEGPYFIVKGIDNTFTVTVDNAAGKLWANCTALPGQNRTGDGLIMAFLGWAVNYGISPFAVTSFNAVDSSGTTVSADLELETGYFKFQKAPIVTMIDTGTGLPLMKSWTTAAHSIGETFQAAVYIVQTSEQVHSWKAGFTFNPRVLQVNWVADAAYLGGNGVFTPGTFDNVNGVVSGYNGTDAAGDSGTGGGALMLVEFTVLDYGVSEMDMTDANVTHQTKLLDLTGQLVETPSGLVFLTPDYTEFEFRASVEVGFATTPGLNPRVLKWTGGLSKCLLLTVTPGTIQVNITINTMEDITGWGLGFRFDKTVLSCTGVSFGGFLSALPGSAVVSTPGFIDNANGIVTAYGETYKDANNNWTKGTGVLLIVDFTVLSAKDTCILLTTADGDLAEAAILDRDGLENTQNLMDSVNERVWGDVNDSGHVSLSDVGKLDLVFSGFSQGPTIDPWCGYINGDCKVSLSDVGKLDLIFSGFPPYPIA